MDIFAASPSTQIFSWQKKRITDSSFRALHMARGGTAACQIALRSHEAFAVDGVRIEGWPHEAEWMPVENVTYSDGMPWPDRLARPRRLEGKPENTVILFVHLSAPADAAAGEYTVKVTPCGPEALGTVILRVYIHSARMPECGKGAMMHEYFFNPNSGFPWRGKDDPPPCRPFYSYERYSRPWWDLMAKMAGNMKGMRLNVLSLGSLALLRDAGSRRTGEESWELNFTLLDQFLACFLENGDFCRIAANMGVRNVYGETIACLDESGECFQMPVSQAEPWAKCLLGGLYRFFQEKGLLSLLEMHLQDEPHAPGDWIWAREMCRKYMPGVRCGEALDTYEVAVELKDHCDVFVPRLEVFEQGVNFFQRRQAAGSEVWTYSCCYPQETEYLNRFIDQPLSHTRLLLWANFAQGVTGFLHWGYNFWDDTSLYGVGPDARFKGDGFVVYPDVENNDVLPSLRYMAAQMGAEEYELLHMAAQKAPEAAMALCRRAAMGFHQYCDDADALDGVRADLFALIDSVWEEADYERGQL